MKRHAIVVALGLLLNQYCAPYERVKIKNSAENETEEKKEAEKKKDIEGRPLTETEEPKTSEVREIEPGDLTAVNLQIDFSVLVEGEIRIVGRDQVTPIMESKSSGDCLSCHSNFGAKNADKLNLEVFPFVWDKSPYKFSSQEKIVERMILSMERGRMPRGRPDLEDAEIQVFRDWLKDGLQETSRVVSEVERPKATIARITLIESGAEASSLRELELTAESNAIAEIFSSKVENLKYASIYEINIIFFGADGVELKSYEGTITAQEEVLLSVSRKMAIEEAIVFQQ